MSICMNIYILFIYSFIYLFIHLFIYLYLYLYLCVCGSSPPTRPSAIEFFDVHPRSACQKLFTDFLHPTAEGSMVLGALSDQSETPTTLSRRPAPFNEGFGLKSGELPRKNREVFIQKWSVFNGKISNI